MVTPSAHVSSVFRVETIIYDCILEALIDPDSPYADEDVQAAFSRICGAVGIDWERLQTEAADEANAESLGSSDSETEGEDDDDSEGDTVVYVVDPDDYATSESSSGDDDL